MARRRPTQPQGPLFKQGPRRSCFVAGLSSCETGLTNALAPTTFLLID